MTTKSLKPVSLQKILNLENMVTFLEFHKETMAIYKICIDYYVIMNYCDKVDLQACFKENRNVG